MNISYKWLKQYVDLHGDAVEVGKQLTSIGLEVEAVEEHETIRGGLKGLVVGEVLTCSIHENSDHLHVTTVNIGSGEPLQIVCGAPNVAAGQKVIVATLGTTLYDGDQSFTIKKSKIRGVESFGMLCAEDEIGIGTSHDGIIVLPTDAVVGTPASEYYHIENDAVIEVDITPNRADAVSHYGVARDLYAYYVAHNMPTALQLPDVSEIKIPQMGTNSISIRVENTDGCPRYTGLALRGIKNCESPEWLKNALLTVGMRPINAVVDVTNYVLMEIGQPMHAFDMSKIKGNTIVVRNAHQDEPFVTLDGTERKLNTNDLMICNISEPMCIAGVFGGLDSGTTMETSDVFLESAYFNPAQIRKTARRHQLSTDASFRYERGADPNITIYAIKRAAQLITEICGGTVEGPIMDNKAADFPPFPVQVSLERIHNLIGKHIDRETIERILNALEIQIKDFDGTTYQLLVPRYRVDVQRDCDVIEDLLRIYGYNNVELSESLHSNLSYSPKPNSARLQERISDMLTSCGFNEILNNSLTRTSYYENSELYPLANAVRIMNPLSADLGVMRQTLLYGGLESMQRNINRKMANLKLYEFGNCYHFNAERRREGVALSPYSEEYHLALWITGNKTEQSWAVQQQKSTVHQLRAYVDNIMLKLGIDIDKCHYEEYDNEIFSQALRISTASKKELGSIGILRKEILKRFDIEQDVFYADLLWRAMLGETKKYKLEATELPKYPEVKRDLALLVDQETPFAALRTAAFNVEKKLLKRVYLFDVYEGKNLPQGKKSYALTFILQDPERTLQDKQIDQIMQRLQDMYVKQFNATIR
ncbi:MAG TPA: phenylalanine--tRNA ligase subunit beta [Bacteroidales bacterium]|nr:phenylalanine--tRNA ligase subunit beta [Bacteroidales bacterium]